MQKKKILSLALAAAAIIGSTGLVGCGKKNTGPVYSRRTNVYKTVELNGPTKARWIDQAFCTGDSMVMLYTEYIDNSGDTAYEETAAPVARVSDETAVEETEAATDEVPAEDGAVTDANGDGIPDGEVPEANSTDDAPTEETASEATLEPETMPTTKRWLYSVKLDGSSSSEIELNLGLNEDNGYFNSIFKGPEGTIYISYQNWINTDTESYAQVMLYNVDFTTGEMKGDPIDLTAAIESAGYNKSETYINTIDYNGSELLLTIDGNILLCDDKGNFQKKLETDASWISTMLYDENEIYYITYVDGKGQQLFAVDKTTGQGSNITTDTLNNAIANGGSLMGCANGKFYFNSQTGVTTWERATDTATEILNYINSDIDRSVVNNLYLLPDGRFAYYGTDYSSKTNKTLVGVLERIPDEQMQDEVILTLACTYTDYYLRKLIIRYNKQNTGVRISVKDYSSYNNEGNNWNGAATQLGNDITVGNVPDILVLDSSLPVESYYKKGVFADLYPFIDSEENGIDRSDLMENLLKACELNGKLYSIITSYYFQTLVAKSDFVGTKPGWTIREMLDAIAKMPEGMVAFSYDFDRSSLQDMLLSACMGSFVNYETGETSFNSQDFIDLIEFLKSCPEKSIQTAYYENVDYDNYDAQAEQEWYNEYEMRFFKNKALFMNAYVSSFDAFTYTMQQFGGNATLIGYPTTDENSSGAVVYPNMELGICAASKNTSSAWQFLKYLLTDEQYAKDNYSFTISKKNMQAKLDQTNQNAEQNGDNEWTDEDWKWYEDNYSEEYVNYLKSSRMKYTPELGQKVMDIVSTATTVVRYDKKLTEIINEELSSFYGGTKSAADTAGIIDSRAKIYISENS